MSTRWLRRLLLASALLVLVIIACSAYLRLLQSGLGCTDWPACYAAVDAAVTPAQPAADTTQSLVRGLHRISASVVSILLILIVLMGWESLGGLKARAVALLVLALAGFLAWLGRFTPSTLPAVLLGNLLGGMLMAALLVGLWRAVVAEPGVRMSNPLAAAPTAVPTALGWLAGAALVVQIALGGLIGARHAALACRRLTDCGGATDWTLFNPFADLVIAADHPALQALPFAHRCMAVIVLVVIIALAIRLIRSGEPDRRRGWLLLLLLFVQFVLGGASTLLPAPLWAVLLHNGVAALLLVTVATAIAGPQAAMPREGG